MTNNKHSISLNYIIKMVTGFSRSYDHHPQDVKY